MNPLKTAASAASLVRKRRGLACMEPPLSRSTPCANQPYDSKRLRPILFDPQARSSNADGSNSKFLNYDLE
jgi:hypothetical protein